MPLASKGLRDCRIADGFVKENCLNIPWTDKRCIFCLKEAQLCAEHLIPKALGGRLTCRFLCVSCNSRFGHALEASAKSDYSVLLAAQHLVEVIPKLAKRVIESHPHVGESEPGPVPGFVRRGKFRVRSQTLEDGSMVQPTDDARKSVARILRKSGYAEMPTRNALAAFDDSQENKRVEIAPGLEIVKWTVQNIEPDINKGRFMNPLIPAKVAFEFLACHLCNLIYDDAPQFSAVRQALNSSNPETDVIHVERLIADKYEPFHGICFEGNDPCAKVQIRLFGWLAFRVHFRHLAFRGPRFIYTHRLDTGEEFVDQIGE